MDQNIFELAKKLAALSPLESGAAIRLIREHGYKHGESASAVIDLAKALISVWDGKASTLDQASAWREVWKYLSDAEMVRESGGRSPVQQVLDILGDYRRMSAGATPLNVQTAFPGTRLVQIMDGELPHEGEQFSSEFDKDILEIKNSCAAVMVRAPKAFTHCESSALIDMLASAVFNLALTVQKSHREVVAFMKPVCVINPGCATQEQAETIARKYRQAHPEIAALWPTPSSEYDPYNAKPCHPSHELYKTGDIDAPEQIKDRNGEVVLDQCRHCGRAESELLDGKPCAVEPVDDSKWEGREFGKGCTVYLKSGGPAMTVADVQHLNGGAVMYLCSWGNGPEEQEDWFRSTSLTRQAPEREPGLFHPGDEVRHAENGERGVVEECSTSGPRECRVRWDDYPDELYWVENRKLNLAAANDKSPQENTRASENLGDVSYETSLALKTLATVVEPARLDVVRRLLVLQDTCYGLANNAGWWTDLETGEDVRNWPKKHLDNWVSAKLMLIVTEVAEAMEGHRKGLKDTHLKHRGMLEVELADAVIRIMDLAGGLNMDVAGAIVEKLAYNMTREDHQIENRKAEGGKSV